MWNDSKIRQNYHCDSQKAPVDSYLPFLEEITEEVAEVNESEVNQSGAENAPLPNYSSISAQPKYSALPWFYVLP